MKEIIQLTQSLQQHPPLFINKPMMYKPGDIFKYNNTGYVMLDLIIEEITKRPFDLFLKESVFKICNIENTGYYEMDRLPSNCANAYIYDKDKGEYYTNIFSVDSKGTGAGGAFTTVLDFYSLWKNLLSGKILPVSIVNNMLSKHATSDEGTYGLGVWLKNEENNSVPFVQGCDPGVSFISSYDTERDICITAVSNRCNNVWKIESNIYNFLTKNI